MDDERRVLCSENRGLADYVLQKKREHANTPKGLSENQGRTFLKAYRNVCDAKDPINTLKDLSQIKGFGKWMLKLMKGYFDTGAGSSEQEDLPANSTARKAKEKKQYIPQRNSAAYALLITLHRGTPNEKDFIRRQELIDAADASGLSQVPIGAEKGKGKLGLGHSKRDWYSGWNCMKTLTQKGLVMKFSNPAKYKLTDKGREVANECIMRSGLSNSLDDDANPKSKADSAGPSRAQTVLATNLLVKLTSYQMMIWTLQSHIPIQNLRQIQQDLLEQKLVKLTSYLMMRRIFHSHIPIQKIQQDLLEHKIVKLILRDLVLKSSDLAMMGTPQIHVHPLASDGVEGITNVPRLPPLTFGETFEEAYEVILILDDREQFATKGSRKIVDYTCSDFKMKIEVRRLPVGDCIWIARHKCLGTEYVLDFIVERKNIDDMRSSFTDGRYRDQKHRLQRSGLKKLMYILEGDPNQSNSGESIKTACFTTEILEDFDVLRTNGLGETLRKYGYLTKSIHQYYKSKVNDEHSKVSPLCPSFDSFVKKCQNLDKMTISNLFAIQLMQVPQVTEEIAIAVVDMYPTLLSLASAYSHLEGNVSAQEEMLKNRSNNVICATASKNIFKLVWSE
ncbi:unnamed protein product [Microthlaspi erraticum]|uniref:Crossover junction endonuclease MUS81 n=1 Tax=Microthlaspi erraticum TaxID=1685480 RepID=A0A6D2KA98_9BRAS|nr:unnamed protein product [Microthlaspi erraticum]